MGVPEGSWLRAMSQTAGRGRSGRVWHSPLGNLYCSTLVKLKDSDPLPHSLSFVAALSCYDTILGFFSRDASGKKLIAAGDALKLKWPNDVLRANAKISGILIERHGDNVIIGIGVNVAVDPNVGEGRSHG